MDKVVDTFPLTAYLNRLNEENSSQNCFKNRQRYYSKQAFLKAAFEDFLILNCGIDYGSVYSS